MPSHPHRRGLRCLLPAVAAVTLLTLAGSAAATAQAVATDTRPATIAASLGGDGDEPVVRLRVSPSSRAAAAQFLLRVFVNRPDANATTPVDSSGFVGSFAFPPDADGAEEVGLPLSPNLAGQLRAATSGPPTVTVVPVPLHPGPSATQGSVTLEAAAIDGL